MMRKQQYGDVEADIKACIGLCKRIAEDEVFAQHVYAALCNQQFFHRDVPHEQQEPWSCTWRHAGGIIADIRNTHYNEPQNTGIIEDYIHWYCSGMGFMASAVAEGVVTDDVRREFTDLGWDIVSYPNEWGV
jgi:hypothetical protein